MLVLFSMTLANLKWFVTRSLIASFYDTSSNKQSDQHYTRPNHTLSEINFLRDNLTENTCAAALRRN
jgi:hypothetical protein